MLADWEGMRGVPVGGRLGGGAGGEEDLVWVTRMGRRTWGRGKLGSSAGRAAGKDNGWTLSATAEGEDVGGSSRLTAARWGGGLREKSV
jgi:hypothetical protein